MSEYSTTVLHERPGADKVPGIKVGSLAVRHSIRPEDVKVVALPEASIDYDARQPYPGKYPSPRVDECRRLVAESYLKEGYITESDLDSHGHLNERVDPYVNDSEYFWKTDKAGNVAATLRIIHPSDGYIPLPIEKSFNLFPEQQEALVRVRESNPESIVEISALAKAENVDRRAGLDMYKAVWQHAKRTGLKLCAISADTRLFDILTETFGEAIDLAGEPTEMMGSLTVPSLLHPDKCANAVAAIYKRKQESGKEITANTYKNLIGYLVDGLETRYLSREEIESFQSLGLMAEPSVLTKYK